MSEKSELNSEVDSLSDCHSVHHDSRYQVESHGSEGSHHVAVRSVRLRHHRSVQVCLQQSPLQLSPGQGHKSGRVRGLWPLVSYMPPAGLANLWRLRVCFHRTAPNCPCSSSLIAEPLSRYRRNNTQNSRSYSMLNENLIP